MTIELQRDPTMTTVHAPGASPLGLPRVEPDALIWTFAGLSGLTAAFVNTSAATGIGVVDGLYRLIFAATIVVLAARARRKTWVIMTGVAVATTGLLITQLLAALAFGLALRCMVMTRRNRRMGALAAALAVPALLAQGASPLEHFSSGWLRDTGGTSAAITAIAVAPLLYSAWKRSSHRRRQTWLRIGRSTFGAVVAIGIVSLGIGFLAGFPARRGLDATVAASDAIRDSDLDTATGHLTNASDHWNAANRLLAGPWMLPGRLIPVLGQNIRAGQVATGQAAAVTTAADRTLRAYDDASLFSDQTVQLDLLDSLIPVVTSLEGTTAVARAQLAEAGSPWLLPQVTESLERAESELAPLERLAIAGVDGLHLAGDLFGSERPSTVLMLVTTPAEARAAGGFVGHWAEFRIEDGRIELVAQHKSRELNDLLDQSGATLRATPDYLARYGRFEVERHIQDVTLSPDGPTVAAVAANLYQQATETRVDAVITIDPFVIDQLLAFTGALETESGIILRTGTAADTLLTTQYEVFANDEAERENLLEGVAAQIMRELLDSPPNPAALVHELGPLAAEGRFSIWFADDPDHFAATVGADNAFPKVALGASGQPTGDLFALVHQNAGQNKIDTYLHRELDMATQIDSDGTVTHAGRLLLRNSAPDRGLADAVIGSNDQGLAPGTNRMTLSFYSPLALDWARVDGEALAIERQREFGVEVYSLVLALDADSERTIDLHFSGHIDIDGGYRLTLGAQPLSRSDQVTWRIDNETVFDGELERDTTLVVSTPGKR